MDYLPPPFFSRGPAPFVRLMFFMSLAVLLMVLDARFRYTESLRQVAAVVVYPLQRVALLPVDLVGGAADYFTSLVSLKQENEQLKTRQLEAANDLLTLESMRAENLQLRRMLDAQEQLPRKATFAEILYTSRDPFSRKVIIDRGTQQGIQAGQAVVDDVGVIGQITRAYPLLAEVTLVTDREQSIPAQVVRNGLRAVVYGGSDPGTLELRFMPVNADIQNGDLLVTSGIDGTYPEGLPVARVVRIERDAAYAFAKVACVPTTGPDRHRQVLVLAHEWKEPPPPPQADSDARPAAKTKRARRP